MRTLWPVVLLTACVEYGIDDKNEDPQNTFDEGNDPVNPLGDSGETTPPEEECNGDDDDGDGQVDEDFPDTDGDGTPDCLEQDCEVSEAPDGTVSILAECEGTTSTVVVDPWDVNIEWQYTSAGSGVIVMPAVGNLTDDNGDGKVDENDMPDIAFTTWSSNTLVALHGDGSGEIFEVNGFNGQGGVTIADADADGEPEIVAFTSDSRIALVDATGSTEWTSATVSHSGYPQPTVADVDGDGMPEVIGDVLVVEGNDGSTDFTMSGVSNSWRTPVAGDIDQDGIQEVILANVVYEGTGSLKWTNPGTGAGNFNAIADVDGDPEGEVIFVSSNQMYVHDADGTLLYQANIPGTNPGPPSVADFDGDGVVEIAIPANTQISVHEMDGTLNWSQPINDSSGLAGCSGYDINGDGVYEVLYADQENLFIYDGTTGDQLYVNGSHSSGTVWEYPVIADVDNDGSAEVVIASNGSKWRGITVFGHNGDGWPKSGTTWGTHDFAVTNLDPDGGVPSPPDPSWQVYNVFRARPSVDDPSSADLAIRLHDLCVGSCASGPIKISFEVFNQGGMDVEAGVIAALYMVNAGLPVLHSTVTLPALPMGASLSGGVFTIEPSELGDGGFVLVIDDDGTGAEQIRECDEDNNRYDYTDPLCQ